eukprot:g9840.t1
MDERRRLLLVGDVEGGLAKLYSQVETQQKKVGAFNALFAVGAFLPALGDSESGAVLAEFVSGTRKVPIETFFIDSRSAAFLQAAPEGKQLCEPGAQMRPQMCDGRVGCHGYSLLGNTSYATLAASHAPDAPAERPLVRAAVPAISFSRIQPTVFTLYLAQNQLSGEIPEDLSQLQNRLSGNIPTSVTSIDRTEVLGLCIMGNMLGNGREVNSSWILTEEKQPFLYYSPKVWSSHIQLLSGMCVLLFGMAVFSCPLGRKFGFFGLPDWPGLAAALAQRPVDRADARWNNRGVKGVVCKPCPCSAMPKDVDMWGRANTLWQGGQFARDELESFWKDGRDRQFNFDSFRGTHPPHIHIIAGWNDMFLQQGLDDFACRLTEARLTIYTGGHFGLITKHAGEVAAETGRCYREHLGGDMLDHRSPVRMQLITTTDETTLGVLRWRAHAAMAVQGSDSLCW